jgi:mono/diheme cytochrome c family protein/exonuclease VII small subunit
MRFYPGRIFAALIVCWAAAPAWSAEAPPSSGTAPAAEREVAEEFFERKIRPLLAQHCFSCHGRGQKKGGLSLDSREGLLAGGESGTAVVLGKPDESLLIEAVRHTGGVEMPPSGKLAEAEIAALRQWLELGAPWPAEKPTSAGGTIRSSGGRVTQADRQFWSFQPIRDHKPPVTKNTAWPRSSIDRFVLARLEAEGLSPAADADPAALVRRVYFDLTGLPPSAEEIEKTRGDAYESLVDRLLASPQFGERWARHWLDLARYGEDQAHTFQARMYPAGYRYRDWVVASLNRDLPFDRFVIEQIAGDLLDGPDAERQARFPALGFFALGPVYYADNACRAKAKSDEYDDRIDTLSRGLLGLTVACARCHDHKFDPISTHDYYALAGVVASTDYFEAPLAPADVVRRYDEAAAKLKEAEQKLKKAEQKLKEAKSKSLPTEDAETTAKALRNEIAERKKAIGEKYPFAHSLKDGKPIDLAVHRRGNHKDLGDVVPRGFLEVLSREGDRRFTTGSGRLELARAIASPENPLTARVFVNRVWQQMFGRGLVGTPSNFGLLGERPTHPELLDHLAARFIASGWSVKTLIREIALSSTYRQASTFSAANFAHDPDNRLLWRANRRRLDVESWRDAVLAVCGTLDPTIGGPSLNLDNAKNRRRTLYAAVSRHELNPMLRLFDFPDPNLTSERRVPTTVPMQQLFVLNSEFMIGQARALAATLAAEKAANDAVRITSAYRRIFGRTPTPNERHWAAEFLAAAATETGKSDVKLSPWEQYVQALLSTNEFTFVD